MLFSEQITVEDYDKSTLSLKRVGLDSVYNSLLSTKWGMP
jgi:hypothetical protein